MKVKDEPGFKQTWHICPKGTASRAVPVRLPHGQVPIPAATGYIPTAVTSFGTVTGATLGNKAHDPADDFSVKSYVLKTASLSEGLLDAR